MAEAAHRIDTRQRRWWIVIGALLIPSLYLLTLATRFDFIDDGNLVYPSAPRPLSEREQLVWHKIAALGIRGHLPAQLGPTGHFVPQQVTRGNVRGPRLERQPLAVRALPGARWRRHDHPDHDFRTTSSPATRVPAQYRLSDVPAILP